MNLTELKIEITNKCSLRCIHCSTDAKKSGWMMQMYVAHRAIEQAAAMGCKSVQLSGGEPFLDPYWQILVKSIQKLGMKCTIYTSGVGNKDYPFPKNDFELTKPDKLIFSLYAAKRSVNNKITGCLSFVKTTDAIRSSIKAGIETELHCVVMKQNIDYLESVVAFAEQEGIQKVSFLRLVPQGRARIYHESTLPSKEDYVKIRSILERLISTSKVPIRLGSPFNFLNLGCGTPCTSGDRAVVTTDGNVYPCDALKGMGPTGAPNNLHFHSLSEIMNGNELFKIMKLQLNGTECELCENFGTCRGGCIAQKFYTEGFGVFSRDPFCLKNVK